MSSQALSLDEVYKSDSLYSEFVSLAQNFNIDEFKSRIDDCFKINPYDTISACQKFITNCYFNAFGLISGGPGHVSEISALNRNVSINELTNLVNSKPWKDHVSLDLLLNALNSKTVTPQLQYSLLSLPDNANVSDPEKSVIKNLGARYSSAFKKLNYTIDANIFDNYKQFVIASLSSIVSNVKEYYNYVTNVRTSPREAISGTQVYNSAVIISKSLCLKDNNYVKLMSDLTIKSKDLISKQKIYNFKLGKGTLNPDEKTKFDAEIKPLNDDIDKLTKDMKIISDGYTYRACFIEFFKDFINFNAESPSEVINEGKELLNSLIDSSYSILKDKKVVLRSLLDARHITYNDALIDSIAGLGEFDIHKWMINNEGRTIITSLNNYISAGNSLSDYASLANALNGVEGLTLDDLITGPDPNPKLKSIINAFNYYKFSDLINNSKTYLSNPLPNYLDGYIQILIKGTYEMPNNLIDDTFRKISTGSELLTLSVIHSLIKKEVINEVITTGGSLIPKIEKLYAYYLDYVRKQGSHFKSLRAYLDDYVSSMAFDLQKELGVETEILSRITHELKNPIKKDFVSSYVKNKGWLNNSLTRMCLNRRGFI